MNPSVQEGVAEEVYRLFEFENEPLTKNIVVSSR